MSQFKVCQVPYVELLVEMEDSGGWWKHITSELMTQTPTLDQVLTSSPLSFNDSLNMLNDLVQYGYLQVVEILSSNDGDPTSPPRLEAVVGRTMAEPGDLGPKTHFSNEAIEAWYRVVGDENMAGRRCLDALLVEAEACDQDARFMLRAIAHLLQINWLHLQFVPTTLVAKQTENTTVAVHSADLVKLAKLLGTLILPPRTNYYPDQLKVAEVAISNMQKLAGSTFNLLLEMCPDDLIPNVKQVDSE